MLVRVQAISKFPTISCRPLPADLSESGYLEN